MIQGHLKGEKSGLILRSTTGSGKSTRVPGMVAETVGGQVLMLEPRRVAARTIAARISVERGSQLGQEIGYHVRFDYTASEKTKILVITEGMLLQYLQSNDTLEGVSAVIIDEFHERSVHCDCALACVRELQETLRPDLKLIVMSATMDVLPLSNYLDLPVCDVDSSLFPVDTVYFRKADRLSRDKRLADEVLEALRFAFEQNILGDVLVFLPGLREIDECVDISSKFLESKSCLPLRMHGSLSQQEQDLIFLDSPKRKVIFSTNIAETSLTIPGVNIVIDSGLCKDTEWDRELNSTKVVTQKISKFSADQRRGRAGRIGPGLCIRLWSMNDQQKLDLEAKPEILRADLSLYLLQIMSWRGHLEGFQWFEAPSDSQLDSTLMFLTSLGCVSQGRLTKLGQDILKNPLGLRSRHLLSAKLQGEDIDKRKDFICGHESLSPQQFERMNVFTSEERSTESYHRALMRAFPDRIGKVNAQGRLVLGSGLGLNVQRSLTLKIGSFYVATEVTFSKRGSHWDRYVDEVIELKERDAKAIFAKNSDDSPLSKEQRTKAIVLHFVENLSTLANTFEDFGRFYQRVLFVANWYPNKVDKDFYRSDSFKAHFELFVSDVKRVEDLGGEQLLEAVRSYFSYGLLQEIERLAPAFIVLPLKGKKAFLRYESFDRVVASARIQDFFGLRALPLLAQGKVAVLAELLAPNYRPAQVTADLKGFWEKGYVEIRKELRARYPKHLWPLPAP